LVLGRAAADHGANVVQAIEAFKEKPSPEPSPEPSPAPEPSSEQEPPPRSRPAAPTSLGDVYNSKFEFGKKFGQYLCGKLSGGEQASQSGGEQGSQSAKGQGSQGGGGQGVQIGGGQAGQGGQTGGQSGGQTGGGSRGGKQGSQSGGQQGPQKWTEGQWLTLPQHVFMMDNRDQKRVKISSQHMKVTGSRFGTTAYSQKICCQNEGEQISNGLALVTLDLKGAGKALIEHKLNAKGEFEVVLDSTHMENLFTLDVQKKDGTWIPQMSLKIRGKPGTEIVDPKPPTFGAEYQGVVLMIDHSGSMCAYDGLSKTRIERVKVDARDKIDQVSKFEDGSIAIMVWDDKQQWLGSDASRLQWYNPSKPAQRADLESRLEKVSDAGGTEMGHALKKLHGDPKFKDVKHIELLCDGDIKGRDDLRQKQIWKPLWGKFEQNQITCRIAAYGKDAKEDDMNAMTSSHDYQGLEWKKC